MNANVFSARTVKEALRKVREVLGPDAVIINETRRQGFVEITASVEYPQAGEAVRVRRSETAEYIERHASARLRHGVHRQRSRRASIARRAGTTVERQIARLIGIAARPVTLPRGRVRLIGPPGSGKTTSVIRLAANHVLNFGADQIAIIGQDVNRLAGCEQLLLASELLRVPVLRSRRRTQPARGDRRKRRGQGAGDHRHARHRRDASSAGRASADLAGLRNVPRIAGHVPSNDAETARRSWRARWCRPACCSATSTRSIRSARCCRSAAREQLPFSVGGRRRRNGGRPRERHREPVGGLRHALVAGAGG